MENEPTRKVLDVRTNGEKGSGNLRVNMSSSSAASYLINYIPLAVLCLLCYHYFNLYQIISICIKLLFLPSLKKNLVPSSLRAATSFLRFPLHHLYFPSAISPLLVSLKPPPHRLSSPRFTKAVPVNGLPIAESRGQFSVLLELDVDVAFHPFLLDVLYSLSYGHTAVLRVPP